MATLIDESTGRRHCLHSKFFVGRNPSCGLHLDSCHASYMHAEFRWTPTGWIVHDLGSRNGTYLNRCRLDARVHQPICAAMTFAFGDPEILFTLIDDTPPVAAAVSDEGIRREAENGLMFLPDPESSAHLTLFTESHRDGWFVEEPDGHRRPVADQEVLEIGGHQWTLELPIVPESTQHLGDEPISLRRAGLRACHTADEEHARIQLVHRGRIIETELGNNPAYLLLTLARARVRDRRNGVSAAQQGWLDVADLLRQFQRNRGWLDTTICRIRQRFAALEAVDSVTIVERRRRTAVRLGMNDVEIVML